MSDTGRVAIVTGAGQGIGAAAARKLAQEGAKVVVSDINEASGGAVAEGVESWEQFDFLAESRCDALQGFLFSRPLGASEFARLIEDGRLLSRVDGGKGACPP